MLLPGGFNLPFESEDNAKNVRHLGSEYYSNNTVAASWASRKLCLVQIFSATGHKSACGKFHDIDNDKRACIDWSGHLPGL